MFKIIKLKNVLIATLLIVSCLLCSISIVVVVESKGIPRQKYVIVIDAGHGGIDGGCEGMQEGSNERELNLKYAKTLKSYFESYGIDVVLTRSTTDGLYSAFASNKKKDDMKKRKEIIEKANADLVVSIHMNAFPQKSVRGAQVYYNPESEISKNLATAMQNSFKKDLPNAKSDPAVGDYYILNCTSTPAVIIECGFLSNVEEEKLLLSESYKEKVCYSILCGIIKYLE